MKIKILNAEYEIEYGALSSAVAYNYIFGNIGGYMDPIDKKIGIHAFSLDDYRKQEKQTDTVIWFELFSAITYELYKVGLFDADEANLVVLDEIYSICPRMEELCDALLDIHTDMIHYICQKEDEWSS